MSLAGKSTLKQSTQERFIHEILSFGNKVADHVEKRLSGFREISKLRNLVSTFFGAVLDHFLRGKKLAEFGLEARDAIWDVLIDLSVEVDEVVSDVKPSLADAYSAREEEAALVYIRQRLKEMISPSVEDLEQCL